MRRHGKTRHVILACHGRVRDSYISYGVDMRQPRQQSSNVRDSAIKAGVKNNLAVPTHSIFTLYGARRDGNGQLQRHRDHEINS